MPFVGGSAAGMAAQICDGYTLLSPSFIKRLAGGELEQLAFELERSLRELRAELVPLDDIPGLQAKNRKIARLSGALQQLAIARARRRQGG